MNFKGAYTSFRDNFILYRIAHEAYRKKCRKKYRGTSDISIIASNCMGGEIYHDLGLPFNSPTINLWMVQPDFLKLVKNLEYYIQSSLEFSEELEKKYSCPVGTLGQGSERITLIFLHYKTQKDAEESWEKRKRRINMKKLCLIMSDRDGITYENMVEFGKLNCYRKILFTYKNYPELPYTYKLEQDGTYPYVRNYQMKKWNGFWRWESQFDCAKWLNGD